MTPVTFCKLEAVKHGEKFVIDLNDVDEPDEHLMFLGWDYKGEAMVSAANTDFVRGFPTRLGKQEEVIKLSH